MKEAPEKIFIKVMKIKTSEGSAGKDLHQSYEGQNREELVE
ncbi:hypothetical protein [Oceanobacillus damuensis]|nr:hypothetical protein [Oceanobacillus damuensis]